MKRRILHNRREIEVNDEDLEQLMGGWIPNFSNLTDGIKNKVLAYVLEEVKKAIADPANREKFKLVIMTWVSTKDFGPKSELIKALFLPMLDDILDVILELEVKQGE
jgi:hypothetical protein